MKKIIFPPKRFTGAPRGTFLMQKDIAIKGYESDCFVISFDASPKTHACDFFLAPCCKDAWVKGIDNAIFLEECVKLFTTIESAHSSIQTVFNSWKEASMITIYSILINEAIQLIEHEKIYKK